MKSQEEIRNILLSLGPTIEDALPPGYKFVLLTGCLYGGEVVADALGNTTPAQTIDLMRLMSEQLVKENPQLGIITTTNETL